MSRRSLGIFILGILMAATLSGAGHAVGAKPSSPGPAASAGRQPKPSESEAPEQEAGGEGDVHGGPVARFHGDQSTSCSLPARTSLTGNWTHGNYVAAWAKADPMMVPAAAHSRCGKPAQAIGHGQPSHPGSSGG